MALFRGKQANEGNPETDKLQTDCAHRHVCFCAGSVPVFRLTIQLVGKSRLNTEWVPCLDSTSPIRIVRVLNVALRFGLKKRNERVKVAVLAAGNPCQSTGPESAKTLKPPMPRSSTVNARKLGHGFGMIGARLYLKGIMIE